MLQDSTLISLAIVDDHPVVLQGLESFFRKEKHISIAGTFTTGNDFLQFLSGHAVQVVLLDITLPDIHGAELCKKIKQLSPATCVLAFSNHSERPLIMQMLQNGASGYLLKNVASEEFLKCIEEALDGQVTFSTEVKKIMARPNTSALKTIPPLTKREKQILQLIAEGKTNPEIANQLSLSILTIETHRRNLMQKFAVKNAAALITEAVQHQLL
ncbi:DNA-binding response regulator, NarL/FixJ family, contains REC and HTH domains [Filimonas lacunae]|uniref:DNA-binding response regulator, NarL/FixJ family, contains REC and HTH domains n=1 Tax=Filimonas lacunae TaxID=477680 RepID=A0A173MCK7_9BACT|nr:response regulator transcription factor [Filimonas lacunae]BAV05313.1 two-component transcriptional regulator, LuxR family [Filimonas lacunae]SIT22039.1 DNA-binding response regulator, NarL/FixJ family, contains REC and HTH domains [Filimonas lacunae]